MYFTAALHTSDLFATFVRLFWTSVSPLALRLMGLQICKEDGPCCSQGTDADTEAKIHHVPPSFAFQEDNGSFYGDLDSDRSPANLDEARFLFHLLCASWRFILLSTVCAVWIIWKHSTLTSEHASLVFTLMQATLSKQLENSARLARLPTESLAVHREPRGRISRLEQGGQLVVDSAILRSAPWMCLAGGELGMRLQLRKAMNLRSVAPPIFDSVLRPISILGLVIRDFEDQVGRIGQHGRR